MATDSVQKGAGVGLSAVSALLFAVIPKCPICLAAYSALFAAVGVNASVLSGIRITLSALLVLSAAWLVLRTVRQRRFLLALGLVTATGVVLSGWIVALPTGVKIVSVLFLSVISLWAVLSRERLDKSNRAGTCGEHC